MTAKATNLQDLLELHEGRRNKLYRCSEGKWTIGVGHNVEERGLPDEVIDLLFQIDMKVAIDDAIAVFGDDVFGSPVIFGIDEVRQSALLDMSFNLGETKLRKFVRLIAAVRAADWPRAAVEASHSRWYDQVGDRGPRIVEMIRTGQWPTE